MRISITMEVFLNPELLYKDKINKHQAMGMVGNVLEGALTELGELVSASSINSTVLEGPDAAN